MKAWSPATKPPTTNSINWTKPPASPRNRASAASAFPTERATWSSKFPSGTRISRKKRNITRASCSAATLRCAVWYAARAIRFVTAIAKPAPPKWRTADAQFCDLEKRMPATFDWDDAEEIGIQLADKYPDADPLSVRYTDLHKWVTALEGFTGDPKQSNEGKLEAIQMAWLEEHNDRKA